MTIDTRNGLRSLEPKYGASAAILIFISFFSDACLVNGQTIYFFAVSESFF